MKTLNFKNSLSPQPHSTHGSVLIITLLILLMLQILAVSQVSFNTTQTHIATNSADAQIAFLTAEGTLNEATNNLLANTYSVTSFLANTNGLYVHDPSSTNRWSSIDWTNSNATINGFQGGSSTQSKYLIELMPSIILPRQNMLTPTQVYRITSRAVGASGNSPVTLQSTLQIQE